MRAWIAAVVVCAAMVGSAPGPVSAQETVGTNAAVIRTVTTRGVGETGWRASVVGGTVRYADRISTGADSRLDVTLRDRSVLTVGANAALTVDRFVFDDEPGALGVAFAMARGVFRFVSGGGGTDRERVAFRTATAAIGIRGTIIEGAVGPEALEILGSEPGLPDISGDPETAAIIVLREGEIEIEVDGDRVVISEVGQAVAISGRRFSRPFVLQSEAGQRFERRLPTPPGGHRGPNAPGGPQGRGPQEQGPGDQGPSTPQPPPPGAPANTPAAAPARPGSSTPPPQQQTAPPSGGSGVRPIPPSPRATPNAGPQPRVQPPAGPRPGAPNGPR